MVEVVTRYKCDACKKEVCMHGNSENVPSWTVGTEIGDLCPTCSYAWENYKKSFVEKMRLDNKETLI